ncbi:hypothetical protein AgCh_015577 [Apium graveolens]
MKMKMIQSYMNFNVVLEWKMKSAVLVGVEMMSRQHISAPSHKEVEKMEDKILHLRFHHKGEFHEIRYIGGVQIVVEGISSDVFSFTVLMEHVKEDLQYSEIGVIYVNKGVESGGWQMVGNDAELYTIVDKVKSGDHVDFFVDTVSCLPPPPPLTPTNKKIVVRVEEYEKNLTAYEMQRAKNVKKNNKVLIALNFPTLADSLKSANTKRKGKERIEKDMEYYIREPEKEASDLMLLKFHQSWSMLLSTYKRPYKHEFCWICLGPWNAHHRKACNGYMETIRRGECEVVSLRASAHEYIKRYAPYYERWVVNEKSREKALAYLSEI